MVNEFHVSRYARNRYQFDQSLFETDGNIILANFHAARRFAHQMNQKRDLVNYPEQMVRAGQINAMGLIEEILHLLINLYRRQKNPKVFTEALAWLEQKIGTKEIHQTFDLFINDFPPLSVYLNQISSEDYANGKTNNNLNREIILEEILMLWLENQNPAMSQFSELFDDSRLKRESNYDQIIFLLLEFFNQQPHFGPNNQNLIDLLRSPALTFPNDLAAQLEFIHGFLISLPETTLFRVVQSLDLIREEERSWFSGPAQAPVLTYEKANEIEHFSSDRDWMPGVVLLAKNTYVWLGQLSKKYQREIHHLDQIPDEELDTLEQWGFTGLWLIGFWQRSQASKKIKEYCGSKDVVASAYSLDEYRIAEDLGGEAAYSNLRERAWRRKIRLASDMVPNHMGLDSPWVYEHPDWFISMDHSPFPAYTFNGPDLSNNPRIGIFLEDHYYTRSDAAVVYKRIDFETGQVAFIYHGNDGTNMPWNDTAQLNYLLPEVREAIIQTILYVARKFPIIRFDAAMVLAKKQYQRLWFPEPGMGGAIPSRSEFGLTREQFDSVFPVEFWREVVDRITKEAPDTLLLAEAFWLMEGYFVRTLGLHRVYNSAFMNMLHHEENANYRLVVKNTLEFDPEVLKRFVNFMNNPDEKTAVEQFGKGDKYIGICILMVTLPGLPMFGHGQIEGFSEKYGMEFHEARWNEQIDQDLVYRHIHDIFPLLHTRSLFVNVDHFLFFDFVTSTGSVDENVFAYLNGNGSEYAFVLYHNQNSNTQGRINTSVKMLDKSNSSNNRGLIQHTLDEGLNLDRQPNSYLIYKDQISGLEYIHSNLEILENGFYKELGPYQSCVFLNFYQVHEDGHHPYSHLAQILNGMGVPNIQKALLEIPYLAIQRSFGLLMNSSMLSKFSEWSTTPLSIPFPDEWMAKIESNLLLFYQEAKEFTGEQENLEKKSS